MKRTNLVNTLEQIGEARLLAYEGERQVAIALGNLMKRALVGMVELITRGAPKTFAH